MLLVEECKTLLRFKNLVRLTSIHIDLLLIIGPVFLYWPSFYLTLIKKINKVWQQDSVKFVISQLIQEELN
jgi:hypothetical protein